MFLQQGTYRICHLGKYYPPITGGIETHVQTLARAQTTLGAHVTVLCVNSFDAKRQRSSRTQTIKEWDCRVRVIRLGRLCSIARLDLCPEFLQNLWKVLNTSYDIVHLHTPNPLMLMAWFFVWLMGCRRTQLVITHHSDVVKQKVLKYAIRPFEFLVYKQAACILTNSVQCIERSDLLKTYRSNLEPLPLGLDISSYCQPSQAALACAQTWQKKYDEPIWLCVGRFTYYKALHIAIQALTLVPGVLIVIGTGSLEKELKSLAGQLNLTERIVWHGYASADELVGAYYAATALWFPSNLPSEGFGLVQVEAMASGCPVINTDIPGSGVPWVSRHEREGLTVPLNDPIALAEAAKRLINEPGLRDRFSKASRKRAQQFDHMTMARRSFEIYGQILERGSQKNLYPERAR